MDSRELLKSQAAERRNPREVTAIPTRKIKWTCHFCEHDFASERTFMNHHCKERERLEELRGPVGQAAYSYYGEWMKLKKRSVPVIETFASSTLYSTFIKFAKWSVKVKLPNTSGFIRTMVETDVQPTLWCRDNVYALYLQGYDVVVPPTKQFVESYDTIMALAKEHECAPQSVFNIIGVDEVLNLLQKRRLSPWFLVTSEVFRDYLGSRGELDALRLSDGVQIGAMIMRVQSDPQLEKLFKEFSAATKEMNL